MGSESKSDAKDLVLEASRLCGIRVSQQEVQHALQDPNFASWAGLHLQPDNLLTPAEIAL